MTDIFDRGHGQRWLLIDLHAPDDLYRDVLKLIALRRDKPPAEK